VIVDTLSFSTAVVTAVEQGAVIYPCPENEEAAKWARQLGAEVAVRRDGVPSRGRYSLSPATYTDIPPGTQVVLPSLNGGGCIRAAQDAPHLLVGALINAGAVADTISGLLKTSGLKATVIACGEIESTSASEVYLRMAVEDYLGAGAILSWLTCQMSPEALVCRKAFEGCRQDLSSILRDCQSARDLRVRGYEEDVVHAGRVDRCRVVPVLTEGRLKRAEV
jgi:2-phosphosulfolactate phosphatase